MQCGIAISTFPSPFLGRMSIYPRSDASGVPGISRYQVTVQRAMPMYVGQFLLSLRDSL